MSRPGAERVGEGIVVTAAALASRRPRSGLAVVCAVLFLTFLDNTIVSVVLAGIQQSLGAGVATLQWVVDGYMLAFAGLMLTGGTLGDLFGRKSVMLGGVAVFSAGSAIAMLAPSSSVLIAGRVIMGIGAAASEPGTLSVIRHLYPEPGPRARAIGAWAAVSGVALALGPILGGAISGATSWREVFAFGVALGMVAFVWGAAVLPESSDPQGRQVDGWGLVLWLTTIVTATVAIIEGEQAGYLTWWVDVLFAASVLAAAGFAVLERTRRDPVLKLGFFRHPGFSGANAIAFAVNFGVFAIFFFTALYLEVVAGFSGYGIALAFLAMAGAMVAAAPASAAWVSRRGPRLPAVLGCVLAGGGILVVNAILAPGVGVGAVAWALAVVGLGFGMTLVTITSSVLTIVPPARSGMAASTVNTFRELGGVFGVAVLGAIVNAQLTSHLTSRLRKLGIPANFRSLVIRQVTHGGAEKLHGAGGGRSGLVRQVISAAYGAFGDGLHLALLIAGSMLLAAAVIALVAVRQPRTTLQRPETRSR
jgi:EmrB/QacA subfamily drug resistance transporter